MVRFIIRAGQLGRRRLIKFTFQYGQIYYNIMRHNLGLAKKIYIPIWLDLLSPSNEALQYPIPLFTFQYGQIYYRQNECNDTIFKRHLHSNMVRFIMTNQNEYDENYWKIYIPIWLDLLLQRKEKSLTYKQHLHSNMVRFIMQETNTEHARNNAIYIPIWLDLLLFFVYQTESILANLHSNMVRFIIR